VTAIPPEAVTAAFNVLAPGWPAAMTAREVVAQALDAAAPHLAPAIADAEREHIIRLLKINGYNLAADLLRGERAGGDGDGG
jgi:hypothetical protein